MKFRTILSAAFALAVTLVLAGVSQASISGSAHDFGSMGWSGNQICQPCHTPHSAIVKDANGHELDGPLWNHTLSSATYTLFDNVSGDVDQNSKLCLSCHDGTVALDSFGGTSGSQFITNAKKILGTDLSNDHPIGAAAVWPASTPSYMVNPTYRDGKRIMPLRKMADGSLAVGCTSCHEPHNRASVPNLLWVNNSNSATTVDGRSVSGSVLCLNCHKK